MGKPKNVIPSIEKTVSIPENLVVAVDLELYSTVEGRVPFGAWKRYISNLIRKDLAARGKQLPNEGDA